MAYRNGNDAACDLCEPLEKSNPGAHSSEDFVSYNLLRGWKGRHSYFPFHDSHNRNYNVSDESNWENSLKPRIRERIANSKNLILILSSTTRDSTALREEIDYGVNVCGLPVIVVYPEYSKESEMIDRRRPIIKKQIRDLWRKLPVFKSSMKQVSTLHIPNKKALIARALENKGFMVETKHAAGIYFYQPV